MHNMKWHYNLNEKIIDENRKFILTDKKLEEKQYINHKSGNLYTKNIKWYKYKCLVCEYSEGWIREGDITKGVGCSCCSGITVVKNINDFATKHHELVKYLENKEDAYRYSGNSGKKVNLKCPECGLIKQSSLNVLVYKGFYCDNCNSIGSKRPDLIKYFVNKEDYKRLTYGSHEKTLVRCDICGNEKYIAVKDLAYYGIGCLNCSKDMSYGEKFVRELLTQLNTEFLMQLSKTTFDWCGGYRYDFYIKNISTIIEVHGAQHYEDRHGYFKNTTLDKQLEIDRIKEEIALNNVDNYIVLDVKKSSMEYIKKSILNSILNSIFDLSKIDWIECSEKASNSLCKEVCEYYQNTGNNIELSEIAKKFGLNKETVRGYLKEGTLNGWCNYITWETVYRLNQESNNDRQYID